VVVEKLLSPKVEHYLRIYVYSDTKELPS
jgi:hypothetical protein